MNNQQIQRIANDCIAYIKLNAEKYKITELWDVDASLEELRRKDEDFKDIIASVIEEKVEEYLTSGERIEVEDRIFSEFRGLGVLDALLKDEDVTEIMINGPKDIFAEKEGRIRRVEQTYEDSDRLRDVIQRIVRDSGAGREINDANPIVDTRLRDGSRVNVVLSPIARFGHTVTIRKFSKEPMTMEKLLEYGSLTPEIAEILKKLVEARYNIFICGDSVIIGLS